MFEIIDKGRMVNDMECYLCPGDTFTLLINDKMVHSFELAQHLPVGMRICKWALIKVSGGLGYIVGDETLWSD